MAKKSISITLYMSELIYDVENKTYLIGRCRNNGTNYEEVSYIQATNDDEVSNQVMISIGAAFANLKMALGEYLETPDVYQSNNVILGADDLTITLLVPSNFNKSGIDSLSRSMHQYVVDVAIGEWFLITNKGDVQEYVALADASLAKIKYAITKRKRPSRPSLV